MQDIENAAFKREVGRRPPFGRYRGMGRLNEDSAGYSLQLFWPGHEFAPGDVEPKLPRPQGFERRDQILGGSLPTGTRLKFKDTYRYKKLQLDSHPAVVAEAEKQSSGDTGIAE